MGKKKKKTSLPDRWTHYLPLGKRIPGTRFIAFKVPLQKSFEWRLAPNERFSPLDLINQVREQEEELGLIIDLTYTTRYYEPEELPDTMQYCKILTIGHEIPDNETILKFKCAVKNFLMENQHNDKLIGVHCTHGLNRTGYLVCRYLIDVEGMDPNTAIELFNRYRGHSIERTNYVEDLKRRHDRRNHHHAAVSRCSQTNERFGPAQNCAVQVVDYRPRKLQQSPSTAPRHFPSRRGRDEQDPHRRHYSTWNPNLITCYDSRQSVYGPQYPPAAGFTQQRWNHSVGHDHGQLHSPYQQQMHVYEGPYLPRQIPHYLQQYKINRHPNRNPY